MENDSEFGAGFGLGVLVGVLFMAFMIWANG